MITFQEAADQMMGVLRLVFPRDNQSARPDFSDDPVRAAGIDQSVNGFFKSFWAIFFAAPFYMISILAARQIILNNETLASTSQLATASVSIFVGVNFTAYIIDWLISIAGIMIIARALDATRRFSSTIVCYNWVQVITTGLQTIPTLLASMIGPAAGIFSLPALGLSIYMLWGIFRKAMGVNASINIAIIIMLISITLATNAAVSGTASALFPSLFNDAPIIETSPPEADNQL